MAGIITSQNTQRPLSSATATQHYHNALWKQVDRSCVPQCRRMSGQGLDGGKEKVMRKTTEGMRKKKVRECWERKNHRGACLSSGSKSQLLSCGNTWHLISTICISAIASLHKVKGWGGIFVIVTSEISLSTIEAWHFCLHVMAMRSKPCKHDLLVSSEEDKPSLVLLLAHQHFA